MKKMASDWRKSWLVRKFVDEEVAPATERRPAQVSSRSFRKTVRKPPRKYWRRGVASRGSQTSTRTPNREFRPASALRPALHFDPVLLGLRRKTPEPSRAKERMAGRIHDLASVEVCEPPGRNPPPPRGAGSSFRAGFGKFFGKLAKQPGAVRRWGLGPFLRNKLGASQPSSRLPISSNLSMTALSPTLRNGARGFVLSERGKKCIARRRVGLRISGIQGGPAGSRS